MAVRYKLAAAPEVKVYLQEWRETKFPTQQALSSAIDLPAPTISRYETGEREWGKGYLEALAYAVKCRVPDLFTPPHVTPEERLRSALLAYGVDRELLDSAILAVEGFRIDSEGDEQPQPDPDPAETASANRLRVKERAK